MSSPTKAKVVLIVLDSLGVGELPDAQTYGDAGSNTLQNLDKAVGGLNLPNLQKLGLGNILSLTGIKPADSPLGSYGKMSERSQGKDTTTGHWEMCGIITEKAFPTYPDGFPDDVIDRLKKTWGRETLGNKPASGTEIIKELGEEHIRTGKPIVYTSADSVLQIAAHEDVIPLGELYRLCESAREIMDGEHKVVRVIARPFKGNPRDFYRTEGRKDYSIEPETETVLDKLKANGVAVHGVGKISDIFSGKGISDDHHVTGNKNILDKTIELANRANAPSLIFANLVDFDMVYGHRNDVEGYANALKEFDKGLTVLFDSIDDDSMLVITADHGCDPTTASTDHSREYVPLLLYGKKLDRGVDLGIRKSFADLGESILDFFGLPGLGVGESFWKKIRL